MGARTTKAWERTGDVRISFVNGSWHVHSQANAGRYAVNPSSTALYCACEDYQLRGQPCKHFLAVRLLLNCQINGEANPTSEQIPQREPRKTYI
jgi:hypothetical protein